MTVQCTKFGSQWQYNRCSCTLDVDASSIIMDGSDVESTTTTWHKKGEEPQTLEVWFSGTHSDMYVAHSSYGLTFTFVHVSDV